MAALSHRLLQFDHCVLELTEEALTFCAAHGDRHREAALENNLADLHHVAGRSVESMEHLKRAVAIFSEVGAGGHVAERARLSARALGAGRGPPRGRSARPS